jgi:uncharacterized protein YciI
MSSNEVSTPRKKLKRSTAVRFALLFLNAALILLGSSSVVASEDIHPAKVTYLLIYRPGPAWPAGKPVAELPLKEHGNYMLSLFKKGTMKQAGPLTDNAGGAVVLEAADAAEANLIVANDPAVKAGIFVSELHPWAPVHWEKYLK